MNDPTTSKTIQKFNPPTPGSQKKQTGELEGMTPPATSPTQWGPAPRHLTEKGSAADMDEFGKLASQDQKRR